MDGDSVFADAKFVRSFRADHLASFKGTGVFAMSSGNPTSLEWVVLDGTATSIPNSTFSGCTSLTNVVLGKSFATLGNNAFANIAGGATVRLSRRRAPTLGDACIYSKNVDNRARILIRRNAAGSGWSDLVDPLTDADRARADFPGEMTIGTISVVVSDVTYTTWVVETEKAKGLLVILR